MTPKIETATEAATVTRTTLFTDVVGSTEVLEQAGVGRWADTIEHHRDEIESVVGPAGGSVACFTGDGFMIAFEDLAAGVDAALRLQWALWARHEVAVRIGVASGAVLPIANGNYLGLSVNLAARLCDACRPGEALISDPAYRAAGTGRTMPPLPLVRLSLRGFSDPVAARCSLALLEGGMAASNLEPALLGAEFGSG